MIWMHAFGHMLFWIATVPVLSALPIGFHALAIKINGEQGKPAGSLVGDVALYCFILSMAGVTDCVSDAQKKKANFTVIFAINASVVVVLYFASLLKVTEQTGTLPTIRSILYIFLTILTMTFVVFKLPEFFRRGKSDVVKQ